MVTSKVIPSFLLCASRASKMLEDDRSFNRVWIVILFKDSLFWATITFTSDLISGSLVKKSNTSKR